MEVITHISRKPINGMADVDKLSTKDCITALASSNVLAMAHHRLSLAVIRAIVTAGRQFKIRANIIMKSMGIRAQQKEKTRRSLIDAAFSQLSADRSFSNLSLREVAREAGIAPTSFYRHFKDMDELGLTMVDEGGLLLRQLMRQARQRIVKEGSVIRTSVETFMEFIESSPNVFRLLLRERSGTSAEFRAAVAREMQHFAAELTEYLISTGMNREEALAQAEASVILVFSSGAEALDLDRRERDELAERLIMQLRMVAKGAYWYRKERERNRLKGEIE
ncbi:Unsaturated fatty acid biosynthesis repressor FabR, TetR family [Vibrio vulnificus]|uniref:Unsaturated fatty acid biosynthesis repressor FabR, TetR family n=1 Tax=Vibrio vulnificus TaxID=672 RepID=A0AAN1UAM8_VIBVL|nr:Unsaturated fatty acid biosynthesis repressor FabR, TetR family [Vibrio vulnificus]